MADHLDVIGSIEVDGNDGTKHFVGSPNMDPSVDITDIYAFRKPVKKEEDEEEQESSKSVLMLNVNPLAIATAFNPDAIYEILVDTNGDASPDIAFKTRFSAVGSDDDEDEKKGGQRATVVRAVGADANAPDFSGSVIVKNARVSFGREGRIKERKGFKFFAGLRSDPFFFDLLGFFAHPIHFTGSDFFADKNVFGIVLEVPNSKLGSNPDVGVWGRVLIQKNGTMTQIDRMGRPAINTVFNSGTDKALFNSIEPTSDRTLIEANGKTFEENVVTALKALSAGAYDTAGATAVAEVLLPDILTFNFNNTDGFLNGRNLTDDVIDIELNLVTKGGLKTDGAGPHTDLLNKFPFLGRPHGVGESDD